MCGVLLHGRMEKACRGLHAAEKLFRHSRASMACTSGTSPVCLVHLVHLVSFVQPKKPDRPDRPNKPDRQTDRTDQMNKTDWRTFSAACCALWKTARCRGGTGYTEQGSRATLPSSQSRSSSLSCPSLACGRFPHPAEC